jgi:hypothetical protein
MCVGVAELLVRRKKIKLPIGLKSIKITKILWATERWPAVLTVIYSASCVNWNMQRALHSTEAGICQSALTLGGCVLFFLPSKPLCVTIHTEL